MSLFSRFLLLTLLAFASLERPSLADDAGPAAPPTAAEPAKSPFSIVLLPLEATVAINPSQRVTQAFEVYNNGTTPLFMSSSIQDWTIGKTGIETSPAGTDPDSAAAWIQLNPQQFVLAPAQTVQVRYTVTAPADLVSEHHAMVFFQTRPVPTRDAQNRLVSIAGRVGGSLFIAPASLYPTKRNVTPMVGQDRIEPDLKAPNPNLTGRITSISLGKDNQTVYGEFENSSKLHYRLDGSIEALDAGGKVLATGSIFAHSLFLPGTSRNIAWKFDAPLPEGVAKLRAVVDFGGTARVGAEVAIAATAPLPPPTLPAVATPATKVTP